MDDRSQYRTLPADQVIDLKFRILPAAQVLAIKTRMRNVARGGILAPVAALPAIDSLAEVRFRMDRGGPLYEAIGIVRWVDEGPRAAGIQFVRVSAPDQPLPSASSAETRAVGGAAPRGHAGTPAATTVFADGPHLVVTGDFGAAVYNGFVSCWAQTLASESDRLFIDITAVHRISSMGVGLLVGAHMDAVKKGKSLTVKVPIAFQRVLSVAGVDRVMRFVYVDGAPGTGAPAAPGESRPPASGARDGQTLIGAPPPPAPSPAAPLPGPLLGEDAPDPVAAAEEDLRREIEKARAERQAQAAGGPPPPPKGEGG